MVAACHGWPPLVDPARAARGSGGVLPRAPASSGPPGICIHRWGRSSTASRIHVSFVPVHAIFGHDHQIDRKNAPARTRGPVRLRHGVAGRACRIHLGRRRRSCKPTGPDGAASPRAKAGVGRRNKQETGRNWRPCARFRWLRPVRAPCFRRRRSVRCRRRCGGRCGCGRPPWRCRARRRPGRAGSGRCRRRGPWPRRR